MSEQNREQARPETGAPAAPYERRRDDGEATATLDAATEEYHGPERRARRRRPSDRRRWRRLLNKWKEPIIGLTIAGAAAPLLHAGVRGGSGPAQPKKAADRQASPGGRQAAEPPEANDDAVAQQWREAAERRMRELTIAGAVAHYGISRGLATKIFDHAVREGIEPDLAYGLVHTESTFRPKVVSRVGARGLTQLLPRTAKWILGAKNAPDLFDVDTNLRAGFRYLHKLIDDYDGNVKLALTAYNRGPGTVNRILKRGGDPDNGYAGRVLTN